MPKRSYQKDRSVVIDVEEAQLLPFLRQNNEDGVHEVEHLGAVEDVEHESHRREVVSGDVGDEFVAWEEGVAVLVSHHQGLDRHPGAQHHLSDIIEELGHLQALHGLHARELHHEGSNDHKQQIGRGDGDSGSEVSEGVVLLQERVGLHTAVLGPLHKGVSDFVDFVPDAHGRRVNGKYE